MMFELGDTQDVTAGETAGPDAADVLTEAPTTAPSAAAAATTGGSVLRGGAWNALSLLLPQIFVLVASAAAARYLGPERTGRQSFISFVEITVVGLATVGIPLSLMRTVGEALGGGRADQVRGLLPWAWRVLGVTGLVGGAVVASGAVVSSYEAAAWLLAGYVAFISVLQTVPGSVLVGMQRWRTAATAGLVTGALSVGALVVVLAAGGGITGLFAVEAVVVTLNLVWTGLLADRALRRLTGERSAARELRGRVLGFARPASLLAVLEVVVWKRSEFFFLAHYSPSAEIAQYSIAFAAVTALSQLPGALIGVTSSFATLHGAGAVERLRSGFTRAVRLTSAVVLPMTAGGLALGPQAIATVYGADYQRAGAVLLLLLLSFPVLPLGTLCGAFLAGRGELRWPLRGLLAAVPVNAGLCLLLVPAHGAVGAAIANVCAQVVAVLPVAWHTWRSLGATAADLRATFLLRSAAVATVAGLAAHMASVQAGVGELARLLVGMAVFALVWLVLARLLRVLSAEDGSWLAIAVGRKAAPLRAAVLALSARPGA